MSRGLSELQKRILVYLRKAPLDHRGRPEWIDRRWDWNNSRIREAIVPGCGGQWTRSNIVAVWRACRRLELRGLIAWEGTGGWLNRRKRVLTPEGIRVVDAIAPDAAEIAERNAKHAAAVAKLSDAERVSDSSPS